jgi:hypothetical protein
MAGIDVLARAPIFVVEAVLDGIECLMAGQAKFKPLSSHGKP